MSIERLLQIAVVVLASLGTILLGIGQSNVLLPVIVVTSAVASLFLTDVRGVIRINRSVATLAGVAAMLIAMVQFVAQGRENQLLAVADLLAYLQIVLMFQAKDARIYWQLLMLSLLQVVVAAALSFSLLFGFLMVLYLFVGLAALSLFFIYRERASLHTAGPAVIQAYSLFPQTRQLEHTGFAPRCREDLNNGRIGRDVARHVLGLGTLTMFLTVLMFFFIPRIGKTSLIQAALGNQTSIGFSETVELGRLGEAFQDGSSVMRVWFTHSEGGERFAIDGEPLFRGAVVDTYVRRGGHGRAGWSHTFNQEGPVAGSGSDGTALPNAGRGPRFVNVRMALEPQPENTVCTVFPAFQLDGDCPVESDLRRQQVVRKSKRGRSDFTLATTAFDGRGRQMPIVAAEDEMSFSEHSIMTALPEVDGQGRDPLKGLRNFAAKVIKDAGARENDIHGKAKALEAALRDSPQFEYTLAAQPRDRSLDPVEDFITLHPKGHCEYFSSALTLMLRSQGIPARMVIGYKGGEFNSWGNYYQVKKLHAHSWVEAFLERSQIPSQFSGQSDFVNGGWLRLDPTPGSADDINRGLSLAERARDWMDYGDYLWTNYIVGLDAKRQQEIIFAPLAFVVDTVKQVFSREFWAVTFPHAIRSLFQAETWLRVWRNLSALSLLLATVVIVPTATLLFWALRRASAAWRRRKAKPSGGHRLQRKVRPPVAFYQQMEKLLERHGIRRSKSQTQHEFAIAIGGQFVESPRLSPAAWLPRHVADAFYRVRFGRHALDKGETEAVEKALRDLAAALTGKPAQGQR